MTEEIKDGGQAFPQPIAVSPMGDCYPAYPGMTLRDYFAAKAMQGMLAGNVPFVDVGYEPKVKATLMEHQAIAAYKMADAMLKAREAA